MDSEHLARVGDPLAQLECAFIEEYLQRSGHHLNDLRELPSEQAVALMKEASAYATGRLTEVETRAHLVLALHDGDESRQQEQDGSATENDNPRCHVKLLLSSNVSKCAERRTHFLIDNSQKSRESYSRRA